MTTRRLADEEIDRTLRQSDAIEPSPGFTAAVMTRVREIAAEPSPIAFPWRRALPGLAGCAAAAAGALVSARPPSQPIWNIVMPSLAADPMTLGIVVTLWSAALGFVVVRFARLLGSWRVI